MTTTTLKDKQMKKWWAVAGLNIILGSIVFIVQVATLCTMQDLVDFICIGIWGGCFVMLAGSLTIRRNPRLFLVSICAMLSGLALVIFYAWNLGIYYHYTGNFDELFVHHYTAYCSSISYIDYYRFCEWRLTSDIIFIVCGSLTLIVNLVLSMNAKAIVVIRPIVIRHSINNDYPMSATNTTYVVTSSQHSPAGNGVIYQTTSPGYPHNQQQQQPVYYIQSNPPAYSATANN